MLAEDIFARRFETSIAGLSRVFRGVEDCAAVEVEATARYWRGKMRPHGANACPLELVIYTTQVFAFDIGGLSAEGWPVAEFELFDDMARAAIDGRAILREERSPSTRSLWGRRLIVPRSDGRDWWVHYTYVPWTDDIEEDAIRRDRHFVPYRRQSSRTG